MNLRAPRRTSTALLGALLLAGTAQNRMAAAEATLLERAFVLDEGKAAPRDAVAAAELYRQAAAAGDLFAHLRLGYLAETGDGVPQDYGVARAHYQAAVDGGLAAARVRLAICHLEGWGGPVDRAAFAREIRLAAEADDAPAQRILGTLYFLGFTVPEDRAEAVRWLERAAKQDDADAQYKLGAVTESARSLALSSHVALARNWYELSAEQEYRTSMRAMARTFLSGPRQDRSWEEGRQWLELATQSGDAEAPYILAVSEVLRRDSPTHDAAKARDWLKLASSRGNMKATEVLQYEIGGKTLAESMQYVLNEPAEERYLRLANRKLGDGPTRAPEALRVVTPIYPQALRLSKVSGNVHVEFTIDTTGRVRDARIVQSPHPLLSERALEAVAQWRFAPGRKDGRLVSVRAQLPMQFELEVEESLEGTDGLLRYATGLAERNESIPSADYRELRPAAFADPPGPPPRLADSRALPPDAYVVLLFCVDAAGVAQRGYVLRSDPAEVGPALLADALKKRFKARTIQGEPVASNVVFPFITGRFRSQGGATKP